MTLELSPPPLQVPADFARDKEKGAFFGALLNTIYKMWNSLYVIRTETEPVRTTDDTNTSLIRVSVPTDRTVMIQAHIVARRTGGAAGAAGDSAFYVLTGAYKNIGGTLTGIGTPDLVSGEDQVAWDVSFSSTGEFAVVIVKGAVDNEITWKGTISTYTVGS